MHGESERGGGCTGRVLGRPRRPLQDGRSVVVDRGELADQLRQTPASSCIDRHTIKRKGRPYSITERRVPEPIQVLGSQPAGD